MSRVCALTGKHRSVGNNVSHAVNRTKRTFFPNLLRRNIKDPVTGQVFSVKLSAKAIKTLKRKGVL